jgi:hypothetical protein
MNRDSEFNSLKVNFDRRVLVMRYSFYLLLVCVCLTLVACDLSSSNQASISSKQDQLVNVTGGFLRAMPIRDVRTGL